MSSSINQPFQRKRLGQRARVRYPRNREATRQRLIEAAGEIIRINGIEELNTVNVTRAAGIVQSGFYLHFKNIDDCKRAAAEAVAGRIRKFIAEHRRSGRGQPADLPTVSRHFREILTLFEKERKFSELLIRHRHDRSPLGLVFRQVLDQMRVDLAADLQQQFQPLLPAEQDPIRFSIWAELLQGMVLQAGDALIDGRLTDTSVLAREMATAAIGMGAAVLGLVPT